VEEQSTGNLNESFSTVYLKALAAGFESLKHKISPASPPERTQLTTVPQDSFVPEATRPYRLAPGGTRRHSPPKDGHDVRCSCDSV
jgi:hypothetical protein